MHSLPTPSEPQGPQLLYACPQCQGCHDVCTWCGSPRLVVLRGRVWCRHCQQELGEPWRRVVLGNCDLTWNSGPLPPEPVLPEPLAQAIEQDHLLIQDMLRDVGLGTVGTVLLVLLLALVPSPGAASVTRTQHSAPLLPARHVPLHVQHPSGGLQPK
jgi:hypothetical protein